jgi:mannan endo-1,4-beta-mannosidase
MKPLIKQFFIGLILCTSLNTANAQTQPSLLHVSGSNLVDDCGETVILKGVNDMNYFEAGHPDDWGLGHFPEIAQTGANTVRIQVALNSTSTQIKPLLDACLANKMIPILEFQDLTGAGSGDPATYGGSSDATVLNQAAAFWTKSNIKTLLLSYQNYLIINMANEPNGAWNVTATDQTSYFNANKTAIAALRTAGYTCPIIIDGMNWGQDVSFFINFGSQLLNNDPQNNLLFSVHAYWPKIWYSDADVTGLIDAMGNSGLPMIFGEFAWATAENNDTQYYDNNYALMLQKASEYNIGYILWWWGDEDVTDMYDGMNMTTNGA